MTAKLSEVQIKEYLSKLELDKNPGRYNILNKLLLCSEFYYMKLLSALIEGRYEIDSLLIYIDTLNDDIIISILNTIEGNSNELIATKNLIREKLFGVDFNNAMNIYSRNFVANEEVGLEINFAELFAQYFKIKNLHYSNFVVGIHFETTVTEKIDFRYFPSYADLVTKFESLMLGFDKSTVMIHEGIDLIKDIKSSMENIFSIPDSFIHILYTRPLISRSDLLFSLFKGEHNFLPFDVWKDKIESFIDSCARDFLSDLNTFSTIEECMDYVRKNYLNSKASLLSSMAETEGIFPELYYDFLFSCYYLQKIPGFASFISPEEILSIEDSNRIRKILKDLFSKINTILLDALFLMKSQLNYEA